MFNILLFSNIHCRTLACTIFSIFMPLFLGLREGPGQISPFFQVVGSYYSQNYLPSIFIPALQAPNILLGTQ